MSRGRVNAAILLAALASMLAAAALASPLPASTSSLQVRVLVLEAHDSARLGVIDRLLVKVVNPAEEAFKPVFFTISGGFTGFNAWDVVDGPPLVPARGEALYLIKPRHLAFSIPLGREFKVAVLDAEDLALKGRSEVECFKPSHFAWPRNPNLLFWSYDVAKGVYEPFAWSFIYCREDAREVAEVMECNGSALLRVGGVRRARGEWLMAGLQQAVGLSSTLKVRVKPMFSTPLDPKPSRLVGVEVGFGDWDWAGRRRISNYTGLPYRALWILFTDEVEQPRLMKSSLSENIALYFIPAKVGEWNEVEVNVTQALLSLNWSLPEPKPIAYSGSSAYGALELPYHGGATLLARRVELTLFVAAYPWDARAGELKEAYFSYADLAPAGPT